MEEKNSQQEQVAMLDELKAINDRYEEIEVEQRRLMKRRANILVRCNHKSRDGNDAVRDGEYYICVVCHTNW